MSLIDRLWRKVNSNVADFNAWVNLLDAAEKHPNIDVTRKAFDEFLVHFPYCYGYWKKYANFERHSGNKELCLRIYQKGVEAIPLSIDLWVAYLDAKIEICHGDDDYEIKMRSLYETALEKAGLEFRSDPLWEQYISWEGGHNRWARVLAIYDRLLRTPTQLYFQNWDSFKKMIEENRPEDYLTIGEFAELLARVSPVAGTAMRIALSDPSNKTVPIPQISESDRNSIRKLVIDRREVVYKTTYVQIMKRWYFEEKIRRPYFHVKPLEEAQLANWAEYLSFEESEAASAEALLAVPSSTDPSTPSVTAGDVKLAKKRVRILYERCLVACALYEHLWIRYAKYLEFTERDIRGARAVWRRACEVHVRAKPTIHWHWALFEARHPAQLDEICTNGGDSSKTTSSPAAAPLTPLEILTNLEGRLIDSALVCARRADAMRREGKPLLEIIACLRSGINRLRVRATEQTHLAHTATGATASFSAAIALATAAQARAGASYLAGKLARLIHRNIGGLVPAEGLPLWQLMLEASFKPGDEKMETETETKTEQLNSNGFKHEEQEQQERQPEEEAGTAPSTAFEKMESEEPAGPHGDDHDDENVEEMEVEMEEEEAAEVTPETLQKTANNQGDDGSASPPVVMGRTAKPPKGSEQQTAEEEVEKQQQEKAVEAETERKRKRRSRWGDTEGSTDRDLAAEAERLARAEREQRDYALHRATITEVRPPPDPSSLPVEQRRIVSPEEAAITILKDAIEFDPRNERLYSQLLDIAYQRRPTDLAGFVEFANLAIVDSILPATIKLAFAQRKLQFLEEFSDDVNQISAAVDEYVQLAQLVVQCANTAAGTGTAPSTATANGDPGAPKPALASVDAASLAYTTPDLLNVTLPTPLRPSAARNPPTNGPVRRMPQTDVAAAILADAAAVGAPSEAATASTAAALKFTAGAYEPLAGPAAGGLPPPAPTMVPIAAGAMPGADAVEVWRGLEPTGYAAAVASSYSSGGGTFYAPAGASADATASVAAPPPPAAAVAAAAAYHKMPPAV